MMITLYQINWFLWDFLDPLFRIYFIIKRILVIIVLFLWKKYYYNLNSFNNKINFIIKLKLSLHPDTEHVEFIISHDYCV
jgi:hypothetical protein